MQFRISYQEVQTMVYRKAGKTIVFSYDSTHTVRIGYDITMLFKTTNVGLDITVVSVDNNSLHLSYGGGYAIQLMVKQALEHAKNQPGAEMIEAGDGNNLTIHLDKNPQLQQILEHVTLEDIRFNEHDIIVEFHLKANSPNL